MARVASVALDVTLRCALEAEVNVAAETGLLACSSRARAERRRHWSMHMHVVNHDKHAALASCAR